MAGLADQLDLHLSFYVSLKILKINRGCDHLTDTGVGVSEREREGGVALKGGGKDRKGE